jgi:hypothetical protein
MSTEEFMRQYFAGEKSEAALILAAPGFTIDYFAEERAEIYLQQLRGFAP